MDDKQIENIKQIAIMNLERDKYLIPIVFLEKRDGDVVIMPLDYKDAQTKHKMHFLIGNLLKTGEFKSFLHISEAFMITRKKEEVNMELDLKKINNNIDALNLRPANQPDKVSVISLSYKTEFGEGSMEVIPFEKVEDKIVFHFDKGHKNKSNNENAGGQIWEMWK